MRPPRNVVRKLAEGVAANSAMTAGPALGKRYARVGAIHGPGRVELAAVKSAQRGKRISRIVAGSAVGAAVVGGMRGRSGPAADRMGRGRPTGPYGY